MLLNAYEVKNTMRNNPDLLKKLLTMIDSKIDIHELKDISVAHSLSNEIEDFFCKKINSINSLEGLITLMSLAGLKRTDSMIKNDMIEIIIQNKESILNKII